MSEAALAFDEAGLTRLDRLRGAVLLWISPRIFVGESNEDLAYRVGIKVCTTHVH